MMKARPENLPVVAVLGASLILGSRVGGQKGAVKFSKKQMLGKRTEEAQTVLKMWG
jgi:hypothetical protein